MKHTRRNFIRSMVALVVPSSIGTLFLAESAGASDKTQSGASSEAVESIEVTNMLVDRTSYHTEVLMDHENKFNFVIEQNIDLLKRVAWLEERVRQTGGINTESGSI